MLPLTRGGGLVVVGVTLVQNGLYAGRTVAAGVMRAAETVDPPAEISAEAAGPVAGRDGAECASPPIGPAVNP